MPHLTSFTFSGTFHVRTLTTVLFFGALQEKALLDECTTTNDSYDFELCKIGHYTRIFSFGCLKKQNRTTDFVLPCFNTLFYRNQHLRFFLDRNFSQK